MNVPATEGVPLIVMTSANHAAVTPVGNPVGVPIPVAPVVACVMSVKAVFRHTVGELDAVAAVFVGVTIIVPLH